MIRAALLSVLSCALLAVGAVGQEVPESELHPMASQVKSQLADAKQPFTLMMKLTVNSGQERTAVAKLMEVIGKGRTEEGCQRYDVSRVAGKPNVFAIYERWATLADYDRHLKQDYMVKAVEDFTPLVSQEPEIIVAVPLEPGS
jgi:quinol monooxygenase YgiN